MPAAAAAAAHSYVRRTPPGFSPAPSSGMRTNPLGPNVLGATTASASGWERRPSRSMKSNHAPRGGSDSAETQFGSVLSRACEHSQQALNPPSNESFSRPSTVLDGVVPRPPRVSVSQPSPDASPGPWAPRRASSASVLAISDSFKQRSPTVVQRLNDAEANVPKKEPTPDGVLRASSFSDLTSNLNVHNTGLQGSGVLDQVRRLNRELEPSKAWLVDPRRSRWLPWWDALIALAIVFTATVTPYEVAFLPTASSPAETLFIINRLVDIVFLLDIVINFVTIYAKGDDVGRVAIVWVEHPHGIMMHYLKGWFILDAASIAVSSVDFYALTIAHETEDAPAGAMANGTQEGRLAGLRALRALRALRLIVSCDAPPLELCRQQLKLLIARKLAMQLAQFND